MSSYGLFFILIAPSNLTLYIERAQLIRVFQESAMDWDFLENIKWAAWTLHYLFSQPRKFVYFKKEKMGCSFKKKGRVDATLFVHPAQLMDCNSKKRSNGL